MNFQNCKIGSQQEVWNRENYATRHAWIFHHSWSKPGRCGIGISRSNVCVNHIQYPFLESADHNSIAGSDTTATAIRSTMLHIITSTQSYKKLQSEVDVAIQSHGISSPITDAEAKKLPYLQACIKEGLRIWPPITGLMPKVCPTDDFINGQLVPAGTQVCWCAWRVFRNKDIFGEDAEMFRPERWLEADEHCLKMMESTAELAFSPGRWQCLGRSIAFIELNKVFVEVSFYLNWLMRIPLTPFLG